jgi:hypothetical protein
MESRFKTEVKNLICKIWTISKNKPWYIRSIRKEAFPNGSIENKELDRMIQEGTLGRKEVQMIIKEKEVELNRLEKQEALLDDARISVLNSRNVSQVAKSIINGKYYGRALGG